MSVAFHSTMILPPDSLHAFYNRSSESCRVLGISTHQTLLDAVASANQHEPFSALPLEAMARVAEIGLRDNTYFASHDANAAAD